MTLPGKKQLLFIGGAATAVAAAATLVAGTTFGLFSATAPSGTHTFTAGTVSLSQSQTFTCVVGTLSPGDGSFTTGSAYNNESGADGQCVLPVSYTGTVPAYLAVDVTVAGAAATPQQTYAAGNTGTTPSAAPGLFDGSANGLQLLVKDSAFGNTFVSNGSAAPGLNYLNGAGTATNLTAATAGCVSTGGNGTETGCSASGSVADLLIGSSATHSSTNITVDYGLPALANNAYDGSTTTLTITVHAVQANNNATVAACTAGRVCGTAANWS